MAETIGTARIDVVVDADKAQAEIKALERGVAQFGGAAEQQYNRATSSTKRYADSLLRQIDLQGKSRLEQIAYNAQLKVGGQLGDEIAKKALAAQAALNGQAGAIDKTTKAFSGSSKTARELQFAMRGLPAQFTDIAISLQSGQRPINVLLQQGGQLKDMFGGLGPALRAMGGYILGLISPLTITAAAVGVLALAWKQGEAEAVGFNRAIIQTGNFARLTAGEMAAMSDRIARTTEATTHSAAAAVAQVAETGRFTAEQIGLVAKAAEQMRVATGQKIDETIAEFEKLRKDPVNAILELNDKYHFLTQAQLDQIESLKEQGRHQEAVSEAFRTYARVIDERAPQIVENLGTIEKALHFIKVGAVGVLDALRSIGREATDAERFNALLTKLQELENPSNFASFAHLQGEARVREIARVRAELKKMQDERVAAEKAANAASTVDSGKERARIEAEKEFGRIVESNLDKRAKLELEITRIRELGAKAGKSEAEIEKQVTEARKRYAESLPKAREVTSPAVGLLDRLERQIALNRAAAQSEEALTVSERLHVEVQREAEKLGRKLSDAERARIELKLAELDVTGKVAEQTKADTQAKQQLLRLTNQLKSEEDNRRAANEAELAGLSHGDEFLQRARRRLEIERDYARGLKELRDRGVAEDSAAYQEQVQALRDARARSLQIEEDYQRRRLALLGDWRVGAHAALEDFSAAAANVAGATRDALGSAFENSADVLAEFVTTGKANFADFAESVIRDFARIEARILLSKAFDWIASFIGGGTPAASAGTRTTGPVFANGAAFLSAPGLSAYSGQVVNKPTVFPFARGVGLMGEAGPEAIMPLQRGPDGKLGVKAHGGSSQLQVTVNLTNKGEPMQAKQTGMRQDGSRVIIDMVLDAVAGDMSKPGGKVNTATAQAFGLSRRGIAVA